MKKNDVVNLMKDALICSVFEAPNNPGLTIDELMEVGSRMGFFKGELKDYLYEATGGEHDGNRLLPDRHFWSFLLLFYHKFNPDLRNVKAFEYIGSELRQILRSEGKENAAIARSVIVNRGVQAGLPRRDLEASITVKILGEHLTETNGIVRFVKGREEWPLPSEQINGHRLPPAIRNDKLNQILLIVRDVLNRRTDGRNPFAEPLAAFGAALPKLGFAHFGVWWAQIVSELASANEQASPVAALTLAAALVEGGLTFIVRYARDAAPGSFKSQTFDGPPNRWKLEELVKSASMGPSPILDQRLRQRTENLIKARQRIHAGRMLADCSGPLPDLQPEQAREARETTDLVIRAILIWMDEHPFEPDDTSESFSG